MPKTIIFSALLGAVLLLQYMGDYMGLKLRVAASGSLLLGIAMLGFSVARQSAMLVFSRRSWLLHLVLVLLLAKVLHDLIFTAATAGWWLAFIQKFEEFCITAGFALYFLGTSNRPNLERWMGIVLALVIYVGVNIIFYELGFMPLDARYKTIDAIGSVINERMLAPFSDGLNSFATVAAMGFGVGTFAGLSALRARRSLFFVLALGAGGICVLALYFVQMRSALLLLFFILGFSAVTSWDLKGARRNYGVVIAVLVFIGSILLPISFSDINSAAYLEQFMPNVVGDLLGRYSRDFMYLGGRVFIWSYGFELIGNGSVGWWGQGIALRDSNAAATAFQSNFSFEYSTTFHNSFLDFYVVYGPLFALFLGAVIAMLMYRFSVNALRSRNPVNRDLWLFRLGVLCVVIVLGYLEAFVISPFFWGILFGLAMDATDSASVNTTHQPYPKR